MSKITLIGLIWPIFYLSITSFLCNFALGGVPLDQFFDFGSGHGDLQLRRCDDDCSERVRLTVPFPFFDTLHEKMWVNINGALSFWDAISKYTPKCGPVEQQYSSIVPFWFVDKRIRKCKKNFFELDIFE